MLYSIGQTGGGEGLRWRPAVYLVVFLGVCSAAGSAVRGGTISYSPVAPKPGRDDVAQLQFDPAAAPRFDSKRDFIDNGGPPSQSFRVPASGSQYLMTGLTVKAMGGAMPYARDFATGDWQVQISQVSGTTLREIARENAPAAALRGISRDWITITFAEPVPLRPGVTYAWSILSKAGFLGLALSGPGDPYRDGIPFNSGTRKYVFGDKAHPDPRQFDRVFLVHLSAGGSMTDDLSPAASAPGSGTRVSAATDTTAVVALPTPRGARGILAQKSGDPPSVRNMWVLNNTMVCLEVEAQNVRVAPPGRYEAGNEDVLEDMPDHPRLQRLLRNGKPHGIVDMAALMLYPEDSVEGASLTPDEVMNNSAYRLTASDDRNYANGAAPEWVGVKALPGNLALPGMYATMQYWIYLGLPAPLKPDRSYELELGKLGCRNLTFRYAPGSSRSEALHVNQVGFRPDDPVKQARWSLWLGAARKPDLTLGSFEVVDADSGRQVLQGSAVQTRIVEQQDNLTPKASMSRSDVYVLDFSALTAPGRYRLRVPEAGTSFTFRIDPSVWAEAFTLVQQGLAAQHSGVRLGAPYVNFERDRSYHSLDGTSVRVAAFSLLDTNMAPFGRGEDFHKLASRTKAGPVLSGALGGYLESGNSGVRRIQHLDVTRAQLELLEMFPQYFENLEVALPGRRGAVLRDEALWHLEFYSKLQQPDGGVCGGIVDPVPESPYPLPPAMGTELLALRPDVFSTYTYAATAAQAAAVTGSAEPVLTARLRQNAIAAMDWAESQLEAATVQAGPIRGAIRDRRNLAAIELLRLTRDRKYLAIFEKTTCLFSKSPSAVQTGAEVVDQRHATFVCARLPESLVGKQLRDNALAAIRFDADAAIAASEANGWGLPGVLPATVPGSLLATQATSLMHAHYLTKGDRYLQPMLQQANFILGANPANTCFVTGLGSAPVRFPLHPYTRVTRQPVPMGLVPYGPCDPSAIGSLPDVKAVLAPLCIPDLAQWPAAECFLDSYVVPEQSAYSVHETLGPAIYLFGYLAAR